MTKICERIGVVRSNLHETTALVERVGRTMLRRESSDSCPSPRWVAAAMAASREQYDAWQVTPNYYSAESLATLTREGPEGQVAALLVAAR
jgi:hypothetical protein